MKTTTTVLGMFSAALVGIASMTGCAGDAVEEETGSSNAELSASCAAKLKEKVGSAAWKKALQDCIDEMVAEAGGSSSSSSGGGSSSGGASADGGAGGAACSLGFRCVDGACTCSGGAKNGASCDGSVSTGATSCSVLCRTCK